jgi:SAM-dependent methyltransferase
MYDELASWWPLLSPPEEYAEEAAFYERALREACAHEPRTLLELGSGGGSNASFMKATLQLTLVDRSPGMLQVSRTLNPECEHVEGDMRTVRLGREFDCVFVHDAVCYLTTEADLRLVMETAYNHCRGGGAVLLAPDWVRETFTAGTDHGGSDRNGRGLRFLEWTWDPDPSDTTYVVDYAYLLREQDGSVRVEQDRHVEGVFSTDCWLRLLGEVGFEPAVVPFVHSDVEADLVLFVGRRPGLTGAPGRSPRAPASRP